MLLHVEKQVATVTGRIEVRHLAEPLQLNAHVLDGQIVAQPTNVLGCACIAAGGDEFTRFDHVPACKFAVEAQFHESSGPQTRQQGSPSSEWVGQMMQHSN